MIAICGTFKCMMTCLSFSMFLLVPVNVSSQGISIPPASALYFREPVTLPHIFPSCFASVAGAQQQCLVPLHDRRPSRVAGAQQQCLVPLHDRQPSRACHVCYSVHVQLRKSLQFGAPTPSGSHVQLPGFEATPWIVQIRFDTYTYFETTVGVVQLTF